MDTLVAIPRQDWPKLRDLYLRDWPTNMVGYCTIDNYIKWLEINPDMENIDIYSLNGDWSDGTFVVMENRIIMLNSLNASHVNLKKVISLIRITPDFIIYTLLARHCEAVLEVLNEKKYFVDVSSGQLYYLPKSEAALLNVEAPDGVTLKPVQEQDLEKVISVWPHRYEDSLPIFKRFNTYNVNVGAYDSHGQLLAWCFRFQTGALAALQVDKDHQRKGLGSLILRAISKRLASMGMDTFGGVMHDNVNSMRMFEGAGFKPVYDVHWVRIFPDGKPVNFVKQ